MSKTTAHLRRALVTAFAAGMLMTGAGAAQAYSQSYDGGGSVMTVNSARTQATVRDGKADGIRAYGNYWRNNSSSRYQLITKAYGETASVSLSGSTRVSSFQACVDRPVGFDGCGTRQYI